MLRSVLFLVALSSMFGCKSMKSSSEAKDVITNVDGETKIFYLTEDKGSMCMVTCSNALQQILTNPNYRATSTTDSNLCARVSNCLKSVNFYNLWVQQDVPQNLKKYNDLLDEALDKDDISVEFEKYSVGLNAALKGISDQIIAKGVRADFNMAEQNRVFQKLNSNYQTRLAKVAKDQTSLQTYQAANKQEQEKKAHSEGQQRLSNRLGLSGATCGRRQSRARLGRAK